MSPITTLTHRSRDVGAWTPQASSSAVPTPSSAPDAGPADTTSDSHVIVLPGGGYADNKAEPIAQWLGLLGLSASVFRYPVHTTHPGPLEAVRAEIRRIRASGAERIALQGSSAGAIWPGTPP